MLYVCSPGLKPADALNEPGSLCVESDWLIHWLTGLLAAWLSFWLTDKAALCLTGLLSFSHIYTPDSHISATWQFLSICCVLQTSVDECRMTTLHKSMTCRFQKISRTIEQIWWELSLSWYRRSSLNLKSGQTLNPPGHRSKCQSTELPNSSVLRGGSMWSIEYFIRTFGEDKSRFSWQWDVTSHDNNVSWAFSRGLSLKK